MHRLDWLLRLILPVTAGTAVIAMAIVAWTTEPNRFEKGFAPEQPLTFSHKLHAGDNKIACQYCHIGVTDSRFATIPSVESCMNCHRQAKPGTDLIKELTRIYEEGEALKWKRVHRLPDHVYFDHRPHVNANIDCAVCHGDMTKKVFPEQVMSVRMGSCLNCHRDPHAQIPQESLRMNLDPKLLGGEHCNACHR